MKSIKKYQELSRGIKHQDESKLSGDITCIKEYKRVPRVSRGVKRYQEVSRDIKRHQQFKNVSRRILPQPNQRPKTTFFWCGIIITPNHHHICDYN